VQWGRAGQDMPPTRGDLGKGRLEHFCNFARPDEQERQRRYDVSRINGEARLAADEDRNREERCKRDEPIFPSLVPANGTPAHGRTPSSQPSEPLNTPFLCGTPTLSSRNHISYPLSVGYWCVPRFAMKTTKLLSRIPSLISHCSVKKTRSSSARSVASSSLKLWMM
jgi:hypothetical protein